MQSSIFDLLGNNDDGEDDENSVSRSEKIIEERNKLINHISSSTVNTLRDRVAWVLNHHPETRDSDIALQIKFWETFEKDRYNGRTITADDLYKLTRLTVITRERARIQNTYKLFVPSSDVRQKRGLLSEEERDKAVEDKPKSYPTLVVYMDESGKNESQLIVGSMWLLGGGYPVLESSQKLTKYKNFSRYDKEFHFSTMSRNDLPIYKEFVKLFLQEAPAFSFKIASVPTIGISNKTDALHQLFYQLLLRGVIDEHEKGRAILPRLLQVWKDAEEEGADKLLVADLEDKLKQAAVSRLKSELYLDEIRCINSSHDHFMQIADLFTASANRILNQPNSQQNHKDEFAEFFLEATGVGKNFSPNEQIGDMVAHISL
jgi:hypothetical protein